MNDMNLKASCGVPLAGRCLFANECLVIRLLGLPCGRDVSTCFAGCRGLLAVTYGEVEVVSGTECKLLREGDTMQLPGSESLQIQSRDEADVVVFERLEGKTKNC